VTDKRKRLKAHWPGRRMNHVMVSISRELYEACYLAADKAEHSMQDEIRHRLSVYEQALQAIKKPAAC
jgi:hypothetical protein